ncbi:hypothetical protein EDD16DRAFT_1720038 [Pisolithus croceorrhizus]|nr:hypothetical protein EDD16DRAFT_1720038 [Pisolithus croceorrhizus]
MSMQWLSLDIAIVAKHYVALHASELPQQPTRRQYDCVCIKYGFGQLHKVSRITWQQNFASTSLEDECQCIYAARLLGDRITSLPPLVSPSSPPSHDYSAPPSICRAEAHQGLAKWAREDRDPNGYVGCCKRAHVKQSIDINQIEDNSGTQANPNETAGHSLSQPVHLHEGEQGIPSPQANEDPIDPTDDDEQLPPPTFPPPTPLL